MVAKYTGREICPLTRVAVLIRDEHICAYCGVDLHTLPIKISRTGKIVSPITIDHLIARSRTTDGILPNGKSVHDPSNLVMACRSCNSQKGNRDWQNYAPGGARKRILRNIRRRLNYDLARVYMTGAIPTDDEIQAGED